MQAMEKGFLKTMNYSKGEVEKDLDEAIALLSGVNAKSISSGILLKPANRREPPGRVRPHAQDTPKSVPHPLRPNAVCRYATCS